MSIDHETNSDIANALIEGGRALTDIFVADEECRQAQRARIRAQFNTLPPYDHEKLNQENPLYISAPPPVADVAEVPSVNYARRYPASWWTFNPDRVALIDPDEPGVVVSTGPVSLGQAVKLWEGNPPRAERPLQRVAHSRVVQPHIAKTKMNAPVRMTKLPATVGFELTALSGNYNEVQPWGWSSDWTTDGVTDAEHRRIAGTVVQKLRKTYKGWAPGSGLDGHCIEIASPVFSNAAGAAQFYRDAWTHLRSHGCTPKNEQTVCGGNHIHFGINNPKKIAHVLRHVARAYYLPWVFTEPDDTESCNNVISSRSLELAPNWGTCRDEENLFRTIYLTEGTPDTPHRVYAWSCHGSKEYAATINFPGKVSTLEFRCVEAPKDEEEFLLQLEFFSRFTKWALKKKSPPVVAISMKQLRKIPRRKALADFKAMLKKLKLPYAPYAKFVKRNLNPRWTLRRERV